MAVLLLFGAASYCQQAGYFIDGNIQGLKEGEKVTMVLSSSKGYGEFNKYTVARDSAYVKNGKFQIKGSVPDGPRRYVMLFDKHNGADSPLKVINLWIQ